MWEAVSKLNVSLYVCRCIDVTTPDWSLTNGHIVPRNAAMLQENQTQEQGETV